MNSKTETLVEQEKITISEKQKTALITGGAGFIGSHLADRLINLSSSRRRGSTTENWRVVVVDNLSTGKRENINPKAVFYETDILSPDLPGIFAKEAPDIVFHLAAQISVRQSTENPIKDAQTNILGSLNVLQNFISVNQRSHQRQFSGKIVFASTGGALYGDATQIPTPEDYPIWPLSPYGIAKSAVEKYLYYYHQIYNLPFASLRLANVYGPRQDPLGEAGVVAIFCNKLLNNEQPIINGTGEQTRDYVFVEDVVEALILAGSEDKTGFFNVGTGKETSVNEIFQTLKKIVGSGQEAFHGPAKPGEQQRSALDYFKIKNELSWEPAINLEQGLEKTVNWFTNNK